MARGWMAALTGLAWCCSSAIAHATCVYSPDLIVGRGDAADRAAIIAAGPEASGPTTRDLYGRVIAPISINGQGPFRFIVDTGANRSVLSEGLATTLGLQPTGEGQVHSIEGVHTAPLTEVNQLAYGDVSLLNATLPILASPMMAGEQGLLGVDGMNGQRLRLDFARHCIEIVPSRSASALRGWARVHGELRFGHLVILHGTVGDVRVNLLIDTGADTSLANTAYRDRVIHTGLHTPDISITSRGAVTAGRPITLGPGIFTPELRLGGGAVKISNIAAFVGDFHVFELWGLTREPTLLLGMDVLSRSRGLAIDYQHGDVFFQLGR